MFHHVLAVLSIIDYSYQETHKVCQFDTIYLLFVHYLLWPIYRPCPILCDLIYDLFTRFGAIHIYLTKGVIGIKKDQLTIPIRHFIKIKMIFALSVSCIFLFVWLFRFRR